MPTEVVIQLVVTGVCLIAITGVCWYVNVYKHRRCCAKRSA